MRVSVTATRGAVVSFGTARTLKSSLIAQTCFISRQVWVSDTEQVPGALAVNNGADNESLIPVLCLKSAGASEIRTLGLRKSAW